MNKTRVRLAALLLAVSFALSGCQPCEKHGGGSGAGTKTITRPAVESTELQFTHPAAGEPVAVFDTTAGVFRAVLFPEQAPQAYDNFVGLVQARFCRRPDRDPGGAGLRGGGRSGCRRQGHHHLERQPLPG